MKQEAFMQSLPEKIETLYQNNVISVVEKEFVRFLMQMDNNEQVLLAAAACVHAQMSGNVCLDIEQLEEGNFLFNDRESAIPIVQNLKGELCRHLLKSEIVSSSDNEELRPLVFDEGRLYLQRYWNYEQELGSWIRNKSSNIYSLSDEATEIIKDLINGGEVNWQDVALCLSMLKDFVVITGGPGTGKTFTVLKIIAALSLLNNHELNIALAAPTGKAARRLTDSIKKGIPNLPLNFQEDLKLPEETLTVHKLLGSDFQGVNFKYNNKNKLPYDLIIVDEASMLDINMWVNLIRAISANTKLIVLGDKDQLASVEAGSILGDICGGSNSFSATITESIQQVTGAEIPVEDHMPKINDSIVFLTKSYRFDEESGIQALADAINKSDADKVIELLKSEDYPDLKLVEPTAENLDEIIKQYAVDHYQQFSKVENGLHLSASNQKKILCALRRGEFGVENINAKSERRIRNQLIGLQSQEWYENRIVIATKNDAVLKIRNGEIGICQGDKEHQVVFEGKDNTTISASRLMNYEPAYSLTIHKSQGSEFDDVAVILPKTMNQILSKEILYTSVTRARRSTLVFGDEEIIRNTVERSIGRSSGLRNLIWS